ncbi:hypothetical protein ACRZ5S_22645 (plasmid) [Vibrio scophthalmi]|uniref:hypothetical protein n=1 Tax=Vibrio scophthalmi TaxID=45658 RepID=UPI003EB71765
MSFFLGFIGIFVISVMGPASILIKYDLMILSLVHLTWLVIGFYVLFVNDKLITGDMKNFALNGYGALAASKMMLRIVFWFRFV